MKIRASNKENGSVLLTTILTSGILGMVLMTYLTLARSQQVSSASTQGWQKSLTFAESGLEEALAKINGAGVGAGPSPSVAPFAAHRDLADGSYDIQIMPGPGASATIYATGYVTIPIISNIFSRAIVVTVTNSSMFTMSVAALTNISMTGKALRNAKASFSDSFDSTDAKGTIHNNGEVACLSGQLNLGPTTISGDLLLGPSATNLSSTVSGQTFHDLNIDLPDVVPPSPYWLPAAFANKSIDGTFYRYIFNNSGQYEYTINGSGSIYVGPDAKVTLQVQSANFLAPDVTVAGANQHAGQLVIYALRPGFTFGDVTVESSKPSQLVYLGTHGNTSLTFSNNTAFTGTIYAPNANVTNNVFKGHGSKMADFTGSLMAKSVHINGSAAFHFDEDLLRNSSVSRGFVVTSWKEL
jgi:hypothetical protein